MTCATYRRRLSPYVDERLASQEREALEAHLGACQGCRRELAALRDMLRMLRTMPAPEAPDLLPGIHRKLHQRPGWLAAWDRLLEQGVSGVPLRGLALAATALLVVVLVGVPRFLGRSERLVSLPTDSLGRMAPSVAEKRSGGRLRGESVADFWERDRSLPQPELQGRNDGVNEAPEHQAIPSASRPLEQPGGAAQAEAPQLALAAPAKDVVTADKRQALSGTHRADDLAEETSAAGMDREQEHESPSALGESAEPPAFSRASDENKSAYRQDEGRSLEAGGSGLEAGTLRRGLSSASSPESSARAASGLFDSRSKKEARAGVAPALHVQWRVADLREATAQINRWVIAQAGHARIMDQRHLSIQLPASALEEFLRRFSSSQAANQVADAAQSRSEAPGAEPSDGAVSTVTLTLELLPLQ